MTDRQFAIFMYFNLQKQAREWLTGIEVNEIKDKYLKNKLIESKDINDKAINQIERILIKNSTSEYADKFWDDSEQFSKILEFIRNEKDNIRKQQLFLIINEFVSGKLKIIEDETGPIPLS